MPRTESVFPIWMATEIPCRRYCLELASSVAILRCFNFHRNKHVPVYMVILVAVETSGGYNLHLGRHIEYKSPLLSRASKGPVHDVENINGPSEKAFL